MDFSCAYKASVLGRRGPAGTPPIGLILAGWDPSAGAGAAADLKTFAAHGVYGEAVLTALTLQSTLGVKAIQPINAAWVERSVAALSADNTFNIIKIGMLYSLEIVQIAIELLRKHNAIPVVIDPVMQATSGALLLEPNALDTFRTQLVPLSSWLTPNLDELATLTGESLPSPVSALWIEAQARKLSEMAPQTNIFITGGHLPNPDDFLLLPGGRGGDWLKGQRVETRATHGTGCTLSSAIAARLARWPDENPLETATAAKRYIEGAMRNAPGIGRGAGPLGHFWEHKRP
jgi:hydroxymethylpyrimidine/phosphomethylpyrimidine kinase